MTTLPQANVANQPPPLAGYDLFGQNRPLAEALEREGARWASEACSAFGTQLSGAPLDWGRLANENPPRLRRDDEVEFHPAWHSLMSLSIAHGVVAERSQVARAALF